MKPKKVNQIHGGGWNKGIPMTEEQKQKLAEGRKKALKKYNPFSDPKYIKIIAEKHCRPIKIIDLNLEFKSVKDCAEYLNCSISTVSSQMSRNKMVKGHKLEYINKI